MSTKIVFTQLDFNKQRYEPTVSIDGITYDYDDSLGPMEYITVSKAYKYQDEDGQSERAKKLLVEGIKKNY